MSVLQIYERHHEKSVRHRIKQNHQTKMPRIYPNTMMTNRRELFLEMDEGTNQVCSDEEGVDPEPETQRAWLEKL